MYERMFWLVKKLTYKHSRKNHSTDHQWVHLYLCQSGLKLISLWINNPLTSENLWLFLCYRDCCRPAKKKYYKPNAHKFLTKNKLCNAPNKTGWKDKSQEGPVHIWPGHDLLRIISIRLTSTIKYQIWGPGWLNHVVPN